MTGAGKGSQGGTGQSGKAQVIIGTHIEMTAPEKEKCQRDLEKQGVAYSREVFFDAIKNDRESIVQTFLTCGMSPETLDPAESDAFGPLEDKDRWSALGWAAWSGAKNAIRLLAAAHADVNRQSGRGQVSPLVWAAAANDPAAVQALLGAGAAVDGAAAGDETALVRAARFGCDKVIIPLLAARADANRSANVCPFLCSYPSASVGCQQATPLMIAIAAWECGFDQGLALSTVRQLIAGGANINATMPTGETALTWAANLLRDQDDRFAQVIIEGGADLKAKQNGIALIRAAKNGRPALVQKLIDGGVDVNAGAGGDGPPLVTVLAATDSGLHDHDTLYNLKFPDTAVAQLWKGRALAACALLKAGADVNLKNRENATAVTLLKKLGYASVAAFQKKSCALPRRLP